MADRTAPTEPQWLRDLANPPAARTKPASVPDPPGFTSGVATKRSNKDKDAVAARKPLTPEETSTLKLKKAWELALGPAKALPMNAVMMYMSGNSLQIFSIMMVFMLFRNPFAALLATGTTFARLETPENRAQMAGVKLVYVALNLLALGLGVWKVNAMGLLPTTRSDWLAWEHARVPLEHTVFAL